MLGSLVLSGVKRVQWSPDGAQLAVMTAHNVFLLSKELSLLCSAKEKMRVKDVLWEEHGVLLYSTLSQVKYLLPSGESGIVRSLEDPVYLVCARGTTLFAFSRENALVKLQIDPTEYLFKVGE